MGRRDRGETEKGLEFEVSEAPRKAGTDEKGTAVRR